MSQIVDKLHQCLITSEFAENHVRNTNHEVFGHMSTVVDKPVRFQVG